MPELEIVDEGRYENVMLGDRMVASHDTETGELAVYDSDEANEEPLFVIEGENNT